MWILSTCVTMSGEKSRNIQPFGRPSCLCASTKSTLSTNGVLHFVQRLGPLEPFYVDNFLLPSLLSVSWQHSSLGYQQFLSAKVLVSLKGTLYSSRGLTSVQIHSLLSSSSLMDSMATSFPISFHTLQVDVKLSYTAELSTNPTCICLHLIAERRAES